MMHLKNKKRGPILLIAVAFLIIIMISAHAFGTVLLSNMILGAFSLRNPILYVLIGLVFGAFILLKFKHMLTHVRKRQRS
ncbi:MAG: hypothetical protein J2P36_22145 [Ktedonobacteraceae bacterium]|jgi:hypothetical protein|nr:hypothetical protein [Ktedonobacteraceae bacterium]